MARFLLLSWYWLNVSTNSGFNQKPTMPAPLTLKSDYLNLLLDLASQRSRERGNRVYEIVLGIPARDLRLLRTIGNDPGLTMGELAYRTTVEKTLASKLVGSLVERGLVQRQIGSTDARQIQLTLTDAGVDLVQRAEPLGHQLEDSFRYWLSEDEIATLRGLLTKIIDAELATRDEFEAWIQQLAASQGHPP